MEKLSWKILPLNFQRNSNKNKKSAFYKRTFFKSTINSFTIKYLSEIISLQY